MSKAVAPHEEPASGWSLWTVFERSIARAAAADSGAVSLWTEAGDPMSGAELAEYVLGLDRALRAAGIGRGDRVMLVNEITAFAMAAALAIIRVGAIFIPNDPNDPAAMRAEIIASANVRAVLAEKEVELPAGVSVISAPAAAGGAEGPAAVWQRDELAAIFFSSGSTGKPKGVQHAATIWFEFVGCHHLEDSGPGQYDQELAPVTWCDGFWHGAVTWYSNWTALSDVFNAIPVIIIDHDTLMNAVKLQELRVQHGLTTMYFSPAHLRAIVDEQPETLSDLTLIYVWGEKLSEALVSAIAEKVPKAYMIDWFGTSETFLGIHRRLFPAEGGLESAHWRADVDTELMLVDPTDHTIRVDDLDTEGEIVFIRNPAKVTICMGYMDNQELTDEKFVPNPHGEGTMFKTGDLGMWVEPAIQTSKGLCRCRHCVERDGDPGTRGTFDSPETGTGVRNGVLTVIGRKDFQVKVRAQMVNLEHVDASASKLDGIADAGSLPYTDAAGETQIMLYVVQSPAYTESFESLRRQTRAGLLEVLPDYAVPTLIEPVDAMPRTTTDKLKRRSLPSVPVQLYEGPPGAFLHPRPQCCTVLTSGAVRLARRTAARACAGHRASQGPRPARAGGFLAGVWRQFS